MSSHGAVLRILSPRIVVTEYASKDISQRACFLEAFLTLLQQHIFQRIFDKASLVMFLNIFSKVQPLQVLTPHNLTPKNSISF